jgi:hypothetical protein
VAVVLRQAAAVAQVVRELLVLLQQERTRVGTAALGYSILQLFMQVAVEERRLTLQQELLVLAVQEAVVILAALQVLTLLLELLIEVEAAVVAVPLVLQIARVVVQEL